MDHVRFLHALEFVGEPNPGLGPRADQRVIQVVEQPTPELRACGAGLDADFAGESDQHQLRFHGVTHLWEPIKTARGPPFGCRG